SGALVPREDMHGNPVTISAIELIEISARLIGTTLFPYTTLFRSPPDRDATLAPLVAGLLLAVPVREGQSVRAGEILARVEGAPLDDALRAAEAAERRADAEAAFRKSAAVRTRTLVDKGVASRQDAEA